MNEIMLRFDIKMRKIYVHSPFKQNNFNKEGGHFLANPVKVCVLRLKNSSRTIIFTQYVYFLLKRTIDKFFLKKVNINFYRSTTVFNL